MFLLTQEYVRADKYSIKTRRIIKLCNSLLFLLFPLASLLSLYFHSFPFLSHSTREVQVVMGEGKGGASPHSVPSLRQGGKKGLPVCFSFCRAGSHLIIAVVLKELIACNGIERGAKNGAGGGRRAGAATGICVMCRESSRG